MRRAVAWITRRCKTLNSTSATMQRRRSTSPDYVCNARPADVASHRSDASAESGDDMIRGPAVLAQSREATAGNEYDLHTPLIAGALRLPEPETPSCADHN